MSEAPVPMVQYYRELAALNRLLADDLDLLANAAEAGDLPEDQVAQRAWEITRVHALAVAGLTQRPVEDLLRSAGDLADEFDDD